MLDVCERGDIMYYVWMSGKVGDVDLACFFAITPTTPFSSWLELSK